MDKLSPEQRSAVMRQVRDKNTKAELRVRRLIHSMGYRYRLHVKTLPGNPDLVFKSRHKVIFIHGCFWHLHDGCRGNRVPSSRREYWVPKLEGNKKRDLESQSKLQEMGWQVLVIWECELKDIESLAPRINTFLEHSP